ncbi:MAG TPA: DUF1232 domain-containing protein [Caldilineae bacterium]|nr:DUF1232 domain-containing protein [Caldilineae bacterium]
MTEKRGQAITYLHILADMEATLKGEIIEPKDTEFRSRKEANFYRSLREKVKRWGEERNLDPAKMEYLLAAPDLFVLLSRLVTDPRVPGEMKAKIAAGLAYFLMPLDIIPDFLGPVGMLDDVFVAAWLVQTIAKELNALDPSILKEHWEGDEEVLDTIRRLLALGEQILGRVMTLRLKREGPRWGQRGK